MSGLLNVVTRRVKDAVSITKPVAAFVATVIRWQIGSLSLSYMVKSWRAFLTGRMYLRKQDVELLCAASKCSAEVVSSLRDPDPILDSVLKIYRSELRSRLKGLTSEGPAIIPYTAYLEIIVENAEAACSHLETVESFGPTFEYVGSLYPN